MRNNGLFAPNQIGLLRVRTPAMYRRVREHAWEAKVAPFLSQEFRAYGKNWGHLCSRGLSATMYIVAVEQSLPSYSPKAAMRSSHQNW